MAFSFKFRELFTKGKIVLLVALLSISAIVVTIAWLVSIKSTATSIQHSVSDSRKIFESETGEWGDLSDRLDEILQQSYSLQSDFDMLENFSWAPFLGNSLQGADSIIEGSIGGLEVLMPIVEHIGEVEGSLFQNEQVIIDILAILEKNQAKLYKSAELIDTGIQGLELAEDSQLIQLQELAAVFRFIADFSLILPEALGMEEAKRYLVLGQTADELRPVGGYVSTIWVLTVYKGELINVDYKDTVAVDDLNHMNLYPTAALPLRQHMQTCCLLMRDVSWEPDFPSVARMAEEIYFLGQGEQVDGVIAVNQWTLQAIVEFLGGLRISGLDVVIQPEEFQTFLRERTDVKGRGYSKLLLTSLIDQLEAGTAGADVKRMADLVQKMLDTKLVMLYFDDHAAQEIVESMGWAGAIAEVSGDYLAVFDSNVGWSKVDGNIMRRWVYEVALDVEVASKASLTLDYVNKSGPTATGCEEQWMASRGSTYEEITHACYWHYFRIYVPHGSRIVYADPMPLPEGAIFAVQGGGMPGGDTINQFAAYSKTGIGGLMVVPPGDDYSAEFLYQLPTSAVTEVAENRYLYRLTMQSQAGVMQTDRQITINLPQDHTAVSWVPAPTVLTQDSATWVMTHLQDATIEVEFER